jgi:hypothetical protein
MNKDEALDKKADNARELGLNYEPEPVAWITEWESKYSSGKILDYIAHTRGEKVEYTPLYTTPPQRTWVGLTQDELNMIGDSMRTWNSWTITDVYFAIEAKLKEKNT